MRRKHHRIVRPYLVTLALAVGLSACVLATDTPPSVEVLDVRLVGVGLLEQRLETTLCVTNPNANEISFRRVTADLEVSGAPLASGTSDRPIRLPAVSSTIVPFTVLSTLRNAGPQLLAILQSGSLAYRLHGSVSLDGTFGITLPFARSGRLSLLDSGLALASNVGDNGPSSCSSAAGTLSRP